MTEGDVTHGLSVKRHPEARTASAHPSVDRRYPYSGRRTSRDCIAPVNDDTDVPGGSTMEIVAIE